MSQKWTQRHFPNLLTAIEQCEKDKIEKEVTKFRQFFKLNHRPDIHPFLSNLQHKFFVSDFLESNFLPKLLIEVNGRSLVSILDSRSDINFLSRRLTQRLKLIISLSLMTVNEKDDKG